jgi:GNAT superfamily N-acetyltransferase
MRTIGAHPDAEASWAAQAEWLRRLAAVPQAQVREVGDGFAVRTGVQSNADNGVVSDEADDAAIADVIAWIDAPAQWLVSARSTLGPRLAAAGCRPERDGVVMGAAIADLPAAAQPPAGVDIVDAFPDLRAGARRHGGGETVAAGIARWRAVAEGTGLVKDAAGAAAALAGVTGVTRLLAVRDGNPVGIAGAIPVGDTLFLQYLAVLEAERGRGIGRALTAARLRGAPPGCRRAVLDPTPDSIPFHRRLGFELRPALRDRVYSLPLRRRASPTPTPPAGPARRS